MLHSFKLKIVFTSVLLTGILLVAFGLFCVQMTWRVGLDRIDRELRALVDADMRKSHTDQHWERYDEALKRMYRTQSDKQIILSVSRSEGDILFESDVWKEQIKHGSIPRPAPPKADPEEKRAKKKKPKRNNPEPQPRIAIGDPVYVTIGTWRVMAIRNQEVEMKLGLSLNPLHEELTRFWKALLLTIPIALLLLIGIGWLLAKLALRPVNTIARTAQKVTALHLDERVPGEKADREFRQLIDVINQMLARLETSFQQAVRFSADAAHELKTPLTILQGRLEAALQTASDGSDDQLAYKESLDEVQRLKSIIRNLLLLAQADSDRLPINAEPLNFSRMIEDLVEDIGILNPEIKVEIDLQPGIQIKADKELLTQIIQNLAGNAVKYCLGESPITLKLTAAEQIEFNITNRGQTIPPEDREKIFERFYRADQAHSRKTDGTGLGLSLAREIAHAHSGRLELMNSTDGETAFRLTLPGAPNDE